MLSQIIPASPLGSLHEESSSAEAKNKKLIKIYIHCTSIYIHLHSLLFYTYGVISLGRSHRHESNILTHQITYELIY